MSELPNLATIARWLLLPPQGLFLLFGLGVLLRECWPRIGQGLSVIAVSLLFLLSTPVVANLLVQPLESFAAPLSSATGSGARAIVVLAAGRFANAPEYGNRDIPDHLALARLRYAAKLYRETGLPVLISGGGERRREPYSLVMARVLRYEFGVPVQWLEKESSTTAENAQFSARILQLYGIRRILLVTDAMHMPRAAMAFRKTGLEVVAAPTIFYGLGYADLRPSHLLPSMEGLRRSYYALYQWLGIAWYGMRYQVAEMD